MVTTQTTSAKSSAFFKAAVTLSVGMSTYFVYRNFLDERYLFGSEPMWGWVMAWMVFPSTNLVVCFAARSAHVRFVCLLFAATYSYAFSYYAFDGSTRDAPTGAQHMHLLLVPMLLAVVALFFFALAKVLLRLRRKN